jgi:hypothetical protein
MRPFIVVALACLVSLAHLPAHATDQPDELMPGRTVVIRYGALRKMIAKPLTGSLFELPDATNDPTVAGGTLLVFDDDPDRPVTAEADLAASAWTALGNPPGSAGYRYRPASPGFGFPCKIVLIRKSVVKAICEGNGYLPTPFLGQVGVVLTTGTSSKRYCALFGGEESKNDATILKRTNAPAPGSCPLDINSSTTTVTSTTVTTTTGPPGFHCCDNAGSCLGGGTWEDCLFLSGQPVEGAVCDASRNCVPPPGTPGGCCDSWPSFGLPFTCGATDATECADIGGTYHPASVCEPSGVCNP